MDLSNPWATPNLRSITTPAPNWRPATGAHGAIVPMGMMHESFAQREHVGVAGGRSVAANAGLQSNQHAIHTPHANSARVTPISSRTAGVSRHVTPNSNSSAASAAAAPGTPSSLSAAALPPFRSSARAQVLQAATSMGLHGWGSMVPPVAAPSVPAAPVQPCVTRFDAVEGAGGLVEFDSWLDQSARLVDLMRAHSRMQREADDVQAAIDAHEREQDSAGVTGTACMDGHAERSWALCQHLSALMSGQADTPVDMRRPEPSQFHLIARDRSPLGHANGSFGDGGGGGQFTHAPAQVHPLLRQLLQQPYTQVGGGQDSGFIQVEPELQSVVCSEIEQMCKDVSEWNAPAPDPNAHVSGEQLTTPPDALAWSSTLQSHHKPMEEILSSVVSSWARVQRVGDGLGSVHNVTKQLHQLERQVDKYAQQQRQTAAVSQAHTFARPH